MVLNALDTVKLTDMQDRHMKLCIIPEVRFILTMQEKLFPNSYPILTLSQVVFLVNLSVLQEQEKDLMIQEEHCFSKLLELLPLKYLSISSLKMYSDCLTITKAGHLQQFSIH